MIEGLRLVGFEQLSATPLRDRLLAARPLFWAGTVLDEDAVQALHDPLFFHQFGGFGAVALSDGADVGYLLGAVSADRLAVVHAVAVDARQRRQGVATALLGRFTELARTLGARAVQAVVAPNDIPARALGRLAGAHETLSPGHAGAGQARLVLTVALGGDQ